VSLNYLHEEQIIVSSTDLTVKDRAKAQSIKLKEERVNTKVQFLQRVKIEAIFYPTFYIDMMGIKYGKSSRCKFRLNPGIVVCGRISCRTVNRRAACKAYFLT